jgi:hypothetical protein
MLCKLAYFAVLKLQIPLSHDQLLNQPAVVLELFLPIFSDLIVIGKKGYLYFHVNKLLRKLHFSDLIILGTKNINFGFPYC